MKVVRRTLWGMDTTPRPGSPSDVSDDEWAFLAPYLTLMREDAPQRKHALREVFHGLRYIARTGLQWRYMPTDLPEKAPCEGVGGLSRQDQVAAVNVDLTPSASALVRKAEADEAEEKRNAAARKLRVASRSAAARGGAASRKANASTVRLAGKRLARKPAKQAAVRLASESSGTGRTKSSRAAQEL